MAPRRPTTTRQASKGDARAYLAKAEEYLQASRDSLDHENFTAATGNAVHAEIAAADGLSAVRSGSTWAGEHSQAPAHLEETGGADGKRAAQQRRRLIPMKNRAEYDPRPVTATDARAAVLAAERLVLLAVKAIDPNGPR